MPEKLDHYQTIAEQLIRRDRELRRWQFQYERASRMEQDLPAPLGELEWIVPFKSSSVFTALRGGQRALEGLEIRPKLHPLTVHKEAGTDQGSNAERIANRWETILKWNYERAARRRGDIGSSMIWNALVYDEIIAQLIHLPTQIAALSALKVNTNRHEAAMRNGDFAIKLHDAKQAHVTYSDYMTEEVLSVSIMTAQQLVNSYGTAAAQIEREIRGNPEKRDEPYAVADYLNYQDHVIWTAPGDGEEAILDGGIELMKDPNPWPFLNYVAVAGGTVTEDLPEFQRKPMVFPVVKAQMWLVVNIIGTLMTSQAIAEGNEPAHLFQGVGADRIFLDLSEPGGRIDIPTNLIQYKQLERQGVDVGLREMLDRYVAEINSATLPRVLVTAESLPGETFSGYNLRVQTAIGSLLPYKRLAERADWGLFELMMLFSHYTKHDLVGYGDGMERWKIKSENIDPDAIIGSVELAPDVPIDRLQKITAAVTLATQLNYSPKRVMEFLGETDPQGALEDYVQWQFALARMQGKMQRITAEESGDIQRLAAEMAQQMIAEAQAEAGAGGSANGRGPLPAVPSPTEEGGILEGLFPGPDDLLRQQLNPEGGGNPAIEALGSLATFEGATGRTRSDTRAGDFETLGGA